MTTYSNVFGGSPVQPSEVAYGTITTAVSLTLSWPTSYLENTNVVARIMDVDATAPGVVLTMPPATEVGNGQDVLFRNVGANSFIVNDNGGNLIITVNQVAPNNTNYIYLTDNSDADGTWGSVQFGAGTSAADAAALAGLGTVALNSLLNTNFPSKSLNANYQVLVGDRASLIVWTGGAGTITLPSSATAPAGFYFAINNAGSGALTITTPDAKNIDGAASVVMDPTESSSFICVSPGSANTWNTLGFGKDTFFQVNVLAPLNISGAATTTLTPSQSSRLIQQFTGALAQNATVEYPAAAGQWYVYNNTTNPYTVTLKLTGLGTGVVIPQGEKLIVYSDATEMYSTPTVSTSVTLFADGNEGAPPISFILDSDTGFYRIGSGEVGYTSNATKSLTLSNYGLGVMAAGAARYYNAGNTQYVGFKAGVLAGSLLWTLPVADATVAGQLWRSDAAGALSFTTATYPATTVANQLLYSSATNTLAGLATANNGVLITSAGGVPSISSTIPNATQDNITRLGTIASGVWNGTGLTVPFGGTGLATLTTSYGVVCAGTTATGALQNAGAGTVNQVFTSNGAGVLPSWKAITVALPAAVKVDQTTGTSTTKYVNPAVQQDHPSACKAWVLFDGTGVTPTNILASYNVASVVETGFSSGVYVITFTIPFSTVNYAVNGTSSYDSSPEATYVNIAGSASFLTTSITIDTRDAAGNLKRSNRVSISCFGAQ